MSSKTRRSDTHMASPPRIAAVVIALLHACKVIKADPDTTLQYKICNGDASTTFAYKDSVKDLLQDIVDKTSSSGFYNYYSESMEFLTKTCYGHGACNGHLSHPDCDACLSAAKQKILELCKLSVGAQVQLTDCRIRYEDYFFQEN
ncbi:hypothetical protein BT93_G1032 [Corymbia citriodora subsp. variegata]|nr:hypothetical protein BT93_G1032 [Corymbia citriodora subsp. variegata]